MRFSILASGSTGNVTYIETERVRVLVDAGLSGKQIGALLGKIGVKPESLDAILLTHEHLDHVRGLGVMARRYGLPIYTNEATWQALPKSVGDIAEAQRHILPCDAEMTIGDLAVESFGTSHDAAEPMGFCLHHKNAKLSLMTDLGYVSEKIVAKVRGSHTLICEANHDTNMLQMGRYPWNVKRRILSDVGHLSNEDAGDALLDILVSETRNVYLAHLSRDNNMIDLAHMTVANVLTDSGVEVGKEVRLHDTYHDRPTPLAET
ncbi:MBL fold metallo-hydrolase [Numidum massiliense]|uniref:MBL fold metallo-hydrolase n=1 Tax=Numidum massiliense TaxID=1522315 RepID=UPI0006D53128|nr:MBL fold metallo-hydrolase [Numidum massiliense]